MKGKKIFLASLAVIVCATFAAPRIYNRIEKIIYPVSYKNEIYYYSMENELDPYMVLALIKAESNFVSDAVSSQGATGLMQLTKSTAEWAAEKMQLEYADNLNIENPEVNIEIGCWYLKYLLDKYNGDVTLSLCAYNAGVGNVEKWLDDERYSIDGKNLYDIPFSETRSYVEKTKKYAQKYKTLYPDIF